MYQYTTYHYIIFQYQEMLARQTSPIQQLPTEQPQELEEDIKDIK